MSWLVGGVASCLILKVVLAIPPEKGEDGPTLVGPVRVCTKPEIRHDRRGRQGRQGVGDCSPAAIMSLFVVSLQLALLSSEPDPCLWDAVSLLLDVLAIALAFEAIREAVCATPITAFGRISRVLATVSPGVASTFGVGFVAHQADEVQEDESVQSSQREYVGPRLSFISRRFSKPMHACFPLLATRVVDAILLSGKTQVPPLTWIYVNIGGFSLTAVGICLPGKIRRRRCRMTDSELTVLPSLVRFEYLQLQVSVRTLPNRADTDADDLNDSEEMNLRSRPELPIMECTAGGALDFPRRSHFQWVDQGRRSRHP